MYGFLIFLFIIVSALMMVTILMQSSKGGGLAGSFGGLGGGGGVFGPRGAANFLQKATTVLAILYLLLCVSIGLLGRPSSGEGGSVIQREMQRQQQQNEASPLPVAPIEESQETLPAPQQETPAENPQE